MGAAELFGVLAAAGVRLEKLDGGRLWAAPRSALTDELRGWITQLKAELLSLLDHRGKAAEAGPDLEWIEERAAILEFDAGLPRAEAEQRALHMALRRCGS